MRRRVSYLFHLLFLLLVILETKCLHLTGTFSNKDFFKFLAKFGYQKVDEKDIESTQGYIYGRITNQKENRELYDLYLVVVDSQYFIKYYAKKDADVSANRCSSMFVDIDTIAWDKFCFRNGKEDFLRRVPCPTNGLCTEEEYNPTGVIDGQQFTYHIIDTTQPR